MIHQYCPNCSGAHSPLLPCSPLSFSSAIGATPVPEPLRLNGLTMEEIRSLAKLLREEGVTHFKSGELDMNLGPLPKAFTPKDGPTPFDAEKVPHKVEELTSALKLSDNDLVDRLFPDTTTDSAEVETP